MDLDIPDKPFFSIGEASKITGVDASVLRYWETEFSCLRPRKRISGQRAYRRDDLKIIFRIRKLLYDELFTIAGARKKLKEERNSQKSGKKSVPDSDLYLFLADLKRGLKSIQNVIDK